MPAFVKGGSPRAPFGKNTYLRSTKGIKTNSYTVSAASVPTELVDGVATKILQSGEVLAKITVGPESGKVGPYQASGTNEVQTITPSGTISGGTWTITFNGQTTTALAYNANAAAIQAALEALSTIGVGNVVVTGGPLSSAAVVLTYQGTQGGLDEPNVSVNTASLTGSSPGASVAQTTQGVAGATDGRQTAANIVGLNDTFLPWQLNEHDVEVAAVTSATAVQAWCYERNAAGARTALSNTTADAMRGTKTLDILFT